MAPNPRLIDQRLQALYDRVPAIDCQGHCHDACCFTDASLRERERMRRASGLELGTVDIFTLPGNPTRFDRHGQPLARYRCTMLTDEGRCGVYEHRPMICRLYGVFEGLRCEYGCEPERMLTTAEAVELLVESMHVGGHTKGMLDSSIDARKTAERHREFFAAFLERGRRRF